MKTTELLEKIVGKQKEYIEEFENHATPHKGFKREIAALESSQELNPFDCIHFDEWQGRNKCCNDKVKSNRCIGVECGEFQGKESQETVNGVDEKLFVLDLLKLNKSERMYSEETVINIIKQVIQFKKQPEGYMNILECISLFDDSETLENKGKYFETIQKDVRKLMK